jgi:hypothetical protein
MKNAHLGAREVSRIGLGAMTMAGTYTSEGGLDHTESIRTIPRTRVAVPASPTAAPPT